MTRPILDVQNLKTVFSTERGEVAAVDGISFSVSPGQTLGLVGESGCGKSVTSLSLLKLLPKPAGRIAHGKILFNGEDLVGFSESQMRGIRGNKISMIFQEPMTSLNPVFTIGNQLQETFVLHQRLKSREARERSIEMLKLVGIPSPDKRIDEYPHQLSGGMRQRVMIAMALACKPALLIADEPTTALDVTIQAQILELMKELQKALGMAMVLITHDLGVVAEVAQDVAVMYAGKIVEMGPVEEVFRNPKHPYTIGLLRSVPRIDASQTKGKRARLDSIPGMVPSLWELPKGCRFQPRCKYSFDRCSQEPSLEKTSGASHLAACHKKEF